MQARWRFTLEWNVYCFVFNIALETLRCEHYNLRLIQLEIEQREREQQGMTRLETMQQYMKSQKNEMQWDKLKTEGTSRRNNASQDEFDDLKHWKAKNALHVCGYVIHFVPKNK